MRTKNLISGILTVVSMVGVAATVYFCFNESSDAKEALEEEKAKRMDDVDEDDEEGDKKEEIKLSFFDTAKVVIPKMKKTVISGGLTMIAIASGQAIHIAVVGGLVASAGLWKDKYDDIDRMLARENPELRKKLHDVVSMKNLEKKFKEMDGTEKKKDSPVDKIKAKAKKATNVGEGMDEFEVYEDYSHQTFFTNKTRILSAKLYMMDKLSAGEDVMFNEILRRLGGKPKETFKDIGWSSFNDEQATIMDDNGNGVNVKIFFETYNGIKKDGVEILIMRFDVDPLKIVYHDGEEGFEEWRQMNY